MATQLKQSPPGSPAWFIETVEASMHHPSMHVVDLTPELAKFILGVNLNNRSFHSSKVVQYAADMAAGKWVFNGEPIIVSIDGNLNDGQHRCQAVIDSNSVIRTAIMFGLERDTRLTVDQGAMRSAADFLGMEGVPNAALAAAIARMVLAYEKGEGKGLSSANTVTSTQVRERVASDPDLAEAATFGHTNGHYSRTFASGSIIGFAYYLLARSDRNDARDWLERVCRGDGLKMRDPAHTLREKMMAEGKLPRDRKIALILKAWNFHRRGMKVAATHLSKELPFPAVM